MERALLVDIGNMAKYWSWSNFRKVRYWFSFEPGGTVRIQIRNRTSSNWSYSIDPARRNDKLSRNRGKRMIINAFP